MNLLRKDKLRQWLLMAVFSAILVPIAVFLGGLLVAGSYEGEAGFFGLTGGIYADVMSGSLSALILLFSPLLLVLVWQLAGTAHRAICNHQRSDHAEADT